MMSNKEIQEIKEILLREIEEEISIEETPTYSAAPSRPYHPVIK